MLVRLVPVVPHPTGVLSMVVVAQAMHLHRLLLLMLVTTEPVFVSIPLRASTAPPAST